MQAIDLNARSLRCMGPDGVRGAPFAYDLLVGADGANSAVRGILQVRPLLPCVRRDVQQPVSNCSHPALPYPTLMSCLCGLLAVACRSVFTVSPVAAQCLAASGLLIEPHGANSIMEGFSVGLRLPYMLPS